MPVSSLVSILCYFYNLQTNPLYTVVVFTASHICGANSNTEDAVINDSMDEDTDNDPMDVEP